MVLEFLFYYFYLAILFSALLTIFTKNPVYSIIYLILIFLNSTGVVLIMGLEFLALLLLIVYVGGIIVLFLFVVMMLNIQLLEINEPFWRYTCLPIYLITFIISCLVFILFLISDNLQIFQNFFPNFFFTTHQIFFLPDFFFFVTNTATIGLIMFSVFAYSFIYISLILFLAMIAAIVLTLHSVLLSKKQDLYRQINTNIGDSIHYYFFQNRISKMIKN